MRVLRFCALATALVLLAGACGGNDDTAAGDPGSDTAGEEPSNEEFCTSVVAAEAAVRVAASGGDPAEAENLLASVEETTPEELREQVSVVLDTVYRALQTQDASAFDDEAFARNEEEVDQWVAGNCGFEAVDVTAVEYAFEGAPDTLSAGTTTFTFTNGGKELHEMILVRFKDEGDSVKDLLKLSDEQAQKKLDFMGASFGPPGTVDTESNEMTPGRYAMLCFVPVGATSAKAARKAEGPPHAARGMSAEFTVE